MNDVLTQVLGGNGTVAGQFLLTSAIVLALLILLYYLARRLSHIRVGGLTRGRAPRLAVVDAAAIDGRRQLILVRRDSVEHLILIGGPSDVVVESFIMRPRQQRPAQAVPSAHVAAVAKAAAEATTRQPFRPVEPSIAAVSRNDQEDAAPIAPDIDHDDRAASADAPMLSRATAGEASRAATMVDAATAPLSRLETPFILPRTTEATPVPTAASRSAEPPTYSTTRASEATATPLRTPESVAPASSRGRTSEGNSALFSLGKPDVDAGPLAPPRSSEAKPAFALSRAGEAKSPPGIAAGPGGTTGGSAVRKSDAVPSLSEFAPPPLPWATASNERGMFPVLDAAPDGSGAARPLPSSRTARVIADDGPLRVPSQATAESIAALAARLPLPENRPSIGQSGRDSFLSESAAHKVSELEAEMNRLLGQLAADR